MAKILRDLLDATEPVFSLSLRQLERASGETGEDARLIGDISKNMSAAMKALKLDPRDTTGPELYSALLARMQADNLRVAKCLGGSDPDDVVQMVPLMVAAADRMKKGRNVWVLKHVAAKRLLRQMPPKRLMAQLGYRSVDSMIKHEDIDEIYVALRFSEGETWLHAYNQLLETVTPSDFETRDIRILVMNHEKYADLAESSVLIRQHNITHAKELGVIAVVPMQAKRMKGITLKSLPLLLHYINEIRLYSSFFKLKQVSGDFGRIVAQTIIADSGAGSQMAGQKVHWRIIQRYFGNIEDERHPASFTPHVHAEDLHWRRTTEMLADIDPEMEFWVGMDYVGRLYDGLPVTLNLLDVSRSYSNSMPYGERYVYHFRESLWNEIFMRYMGKRNLEAQVLKQLDNDMIAPEELKI